MWEEIWADAELQEKKPKTEKNKKKSKPGKKENSWHICPGSCSFLIVTETNSKGSNK